MSYFQLKQKHRTLRDKQPENLTLRIHRALSWLERAEQFKDDEDFRFISLWIAFNAAYASDMSDTSLSVSEQTHFQEFLKKICSLDVSQRISALVWRKFSGTIEELLNNQYVYQPYWDCLNQNRTDWESGFIASKKKAHKALADQDTALVLSIVFSRLYTLRNQLVHGGATWKGRINRGQVSDAASFMGDFLPVLIEVMMDNPNTLWGDPYYPVV